LQRPEGKLAAASEHRSHDCLARASTPHLVEIAGNPEPFRPLLYLEPSSIGVARSILSLVDGLQRFALPYRHPAEDHDVLAAGT
jgi:hypothetical protein